MYGARGIFPTVLKRKSTKYMFFVAVVGLLHCNTHSLTHDMSLLVLAPATFAIYAFTWS